MSAELRRRRDDWIPRPLRDWLLITVMFGMLAIMNVISGLSAREARSEAVKVREALEDVNVTAQNRCIIRVVLSFPPPVNEDEFDRVLGDYDDCIEEETAAVRQRSQGRRGR